MAIRGWSIAAFLASVVAAACVALLPLGTSYSVTSDGGSTTTPSTLDWSGSPILIACVVLPIVVTALAASLPPPYRLPLAVAAVVVLATVTMLGALSIGVFYVPALILSVIALARSGARRGLARG